MFSRKSICLSLFAALCCILLDARPVNRTVTLRQPDGSLFSAVICGDEYSHSVRDIQGHLIETDSEGYWCYSAVLADGSRERSNCRVGDFAPAHILSASLGEAPASAYSRERRSSVEQLRMRLFSAKDAEQGPKKRHCAIILADFQDVRMTYPREDFVNMVTLPGYGRDGATGSADDYFREQLGDDFELSYEISEVVTLSGTMASYFGNDASGNDKNAAAAVAEACRLAAEAGFDFSLCDDDGDGKVDNVFIFVAGRDEADGGGDDCVWSHAHYISLTQFKGLAIGGKIIDSYAISTEQRLCEDGEFRFTSIGTFCHEYSHVLGLMDMYDTDYAGSGGYGNGLWYTTALMDGGSMNNECNTPPHYCAVDYDSMGLGHAEPLEKGEYLLEDIGVNRRYLKLESGNEGEYYLFEFRNGEGWDRHMGGRGLLVYHVDRSGNPAGHSDWLGRVCSAAERWTYNEVNCRPEKQCAAMISATSGLSAYDSRGRLKGNVSQVFFDGVNSSSFTVASNPPFVFNDGTPSPLFITDIRIDGDKIRFKVIENQGREVPDVVLGDTDIFQDAAIISWAAGDPSYGGDAKLCWSLAGGEENEVLVKPYADGKYAFTLEGLQPASSYRVSISFRLDGVPGTEATVDFTTKRMYDGHPFIFLNNVSRNEDSSFPEDARLPLRVFNAGTDVKSVKWYMGGTLIGTGPDGYYHVNGSGVLKAVVTHGDGSADVIRKEIRVR